MDQERGEDTYGEEARMTNQYEQFPIFPSVDSEYIVEKKYPAGEGVRSAMYPKAPIVGAELISVCIFKGDVYYWWRVKLEWWDLVGRLIRWISKRKEEEEGE